MFNERSDWSARIFSTVTEIFAVTRNWCWKIWLRHIKHESFNRLLCSGPSTASSIPPLIVSLKEFVGNDCSWGRVRPQFCQHCQRPGNILSLSLPLHWEWWFWNDGPELPSHAHSPRNHSLYLCSWHKPLRLTVFNWAMYLSLSVKINQQIAPHQIWCYNIAL